MNKFELNDKLAGLYFIPKATEIGFINGLRQEILLIDDWNRLMDLAVDNRLRVYFCSSCAICTDGKEIQINEFISNHESPQEATKFAIAMALVKLEEDKNET